LHGLTTQIFSLQWTYERENQSMAWLCAGMDDQDSLLCLLFGALFVGSMRLEYAGSKTSLYNVSQWNVSGQHSVVSGQVTLWSDKDQAVMK